MGGYAAFGFRVKVSMKNDFYTYAYLREDKTPYYIGKGCGRRYRVKQGRVICPPTDLSRIVILKKDLTEEEAVRHEIYMISILGRKDINTGILRNRTNGGDGVTGLTHTKESRNKMRIAKTGVSLSNKHKQKIKEGLNSSVKLKVAKNQPVMGTRPDGEVFYFDSIEEATKITGAVNISGCCRGIRRKAGGWTWVYFEKKS